MTAKKVEPTAQEIATAIAAIADQPERLLRAAGLEKSAVTVAAASDIWGHRVGHVTIVNVDFSGDPLVPGQIEVTWHVTLRRGVVHAVGHTRSLVREDGRTLDTLPPLSLSEDE